MSYDYDPHDEAEPERDNPGTCPDCGEHLERVGYKTICPWCGGDE